MQVENSSAPPVGWPSLNRPVARDVVGGFREGLGTPIEGFRFMAAHPGLWRFAIVPILLNCLITVLLLALLIAAGVWFAIKIHPRFPQTGWGLAFEIASAVALLLVAGALALAAGMVLNSIFCGYFHAKLARQVELLLGMRPEEIREISLAAEVADGLGDVGRLVGINGGLLLLNIVPLVGSLAALLLGIYFNGMALGAEHLEMPMSLRGIRRPEQRSFCRRHRWPTIGLGTAVFLLALIPLAGSVFLATAAAGAVLLFRRLEQPTVSAAPSDRSEA